MVEMIDELHDKYRNPVFRIYYSLAEARRNSLRLHRHTMLELSLILAGRGMYHTEQGDEEIAPGDIFLFASNECHCITDIAPGGEPADMQILNIHFSPNFMADTAEPHESELLNVFFRRRCGFSNRLDRDNPARAKISDLFLLIRKECSTKPPCYRSRVRFLLSELLIGLTRDFELTDTADADSGFSSVRYPDEINRAVAYINRHLCEEITLKEIARVSTLSRSTFADAFRCTMHMSTWDYINIRRIEKAITLLRTTDDTVFGIATQCGFNNTANFNRIFRKITGTTPTAYRR